VTPNKYCIFYINKKGYDFDTRKICYTLFAVSLTNEIFKRCPSHPVFFLSSLAGMIWVGRRTDGAVHSGELSDLRPVVTSLGPATCTRLCDSYWMTVNYRHYNSGLCPNWSAGFLYGFKNYGFVDISRYNVDLQVSTLLNKIYRVWF